MSAKEGDDGAAPGGTAFEVLGWAHQWAPCHMHSTVLSPDKGTMTGSAQHSASV